MQTDYSLFNTEQETVPMSSGGAMRLLQHNCYSADQKKIMPQHRKKCTPRNKFNFDDSRAGVVEPVA